MVEKKEALEEFNEKYVKIKSTEKILALEEYFQIHKDELAKDFVQSFIKICLKIKDMQRENKKGKAGCISYSMLRTGIMDRSYKYIIDVYDKTWYFDKKECQAFYDTGWAFGFLERLESELEIERTHSPYLALISIPDIERIKLREAKRYNSYIVELARYALTSVDSLSEYLMIDREEEVEVRVGEYMDISEVVFKEDSKLKDSKKTKEWLEEKSTYVYAYNVLKNLNLGDGDYSGIDLRYTDLSLSNLTGSNMRECILMGTKFNNCLMEDTDFTSAVIYEADFRRCILKRAVFSCAQGSGGIINPEWDRPGFKGVNFEGADIECAEFRKANLKNANFKSTNLKNVNFLEAYLEGADFTGALFENIVFSEGALKKVRLDELQKKSIIVKKIYKLKEVTQ